MRAAVEADAPRLRELVRSAYSRYVERIGGEPRPMRDDYVDVIASWDVTVADDGGEIVGLLCLR